MENIVPWLVLAFRMWLVVCAILYAYWLSQCKWRKEEEQVSESSKLRVVVGTGAFLALSLTIYHGLGATFPFVRKLFYYWWEGDIEIPIHAALALIVSIWITGALHARYCEMPRKDQETDKLDEENRELRLRVQELEEMLAVEEDGDDD